MAQAPEDVTVIVCSDHGFHPDHLRPVQLPKEPAAPAVEHRDLGVFLMAGPGIKRDRLIHGASLLDITPTILTLYGRCRWARTWTASPCWKPSRHRPRFPAFRAGTRSRAMMRG